MRLLVMMMFFGLASVVYVGQAQGQCVDLMNNQRYQALGAEAMEAQERDDASAALRALEQMLEICKLDPDVRYSIARVRQKSGECQEALDSFGRARESLREAQALGLGDWWVSEAQIDERLAELLQSCPALQAPGRVQVTCSDSEVSLTLPGEPPRPCPASLEMPPGRYTIAASKAGYHEQRLEFAVEAGAEVRVRVEAMQALQGELRLACAPTLTEVTVKHLESGEQQQVGCDGAAVPLPWGDYELWGDGAEGQRFRIDSEVGVALNVQAGEIREGPDGRGSSSSSVLAWSLAGGGLGLVIGGGVLQGLAMTQVNDLGADNEWEDAKETHATAKVMSAVGISSMAVGAILLGTGVVLMVVGDESAEHEIAVGPSGVQWLWRF